jgi:hypothetical protein
MRLTIGQYAHDRQSRRIGERAQDVDELNCVEGGCGVRVHSLGGHGILQDCLTVVELRSTVTV